MQTKVEQKKPKLPRLTRRNKFKFRGTVHIDGDKPVIRQHNRDVDIATRLAEWSKVAIDGRMVLLQAVWAGDKKPNPILSNADGLIADMRSCAGGRVHVEVLFVA